LQHDCKSAGVEMAYKEKLRNMITENKGLILTKQLSEAGILRVYLSSLVNTGLLVKLERGINVQYDENLSDSAFRKVILSRYKFIKSMEQDGFC